MKVRHIVLDTGHDAIFKNNEDEMDYTFTGVHQHDAFLAAKQSSQLISDTLLVSATGARLMFLIKSWFPRLVRSTVY